MKLSEAMMLGATVNKLDWKSWEGCLLGVSVAALGKNNVANREARQRWPWITEVISCPPIYRQHFSTIREASVVNILSNMAEWVAGGEMTLEQAADWVRSVEPSEPSEPSEPVLEAVNAERSLV